MNTTKELAALVIACIIVAAVGVPMAISDTSMTAGVDNEPPVVVIEIIAPDPADPGDDVTVSGTLCDPNALDLDEITMFSYKVKKPNGDVYREGEMPQLAAAWTLMFELGAPIEVPPGTWTVEVTATKEGGLSGTDDKEFTVSAVPMYEIDFGTVGVAYGPVSIGVKKTVEGDDSMSTPLHPTIKNLGNVVLDVKIAAKHLTAGAGGSDIIECRYIGAAVGTEDEQDLEEERTFNVDIVPGATAKIDYTLTAPVGTPPGDYTGRTDVTGIVG